MKNTRGHFCWACGRMRSNESFSGRGHARHLCRECARMPAEDLRLRQAERDIDRLLGRGGGRVGRKQRSLFERFLTHQDPRIRAYAAAIAASDAAERAEYREARRAELEAEE